MGSKTEQLRAENAFLTKQIKISEKALKNQQIKKLFLMHEAKERASLKNKTVKTVDRTSESEDVYNKSQADKIKVKINE